MYKFYMKKKTSLKIQVSGKKNTCVRCQDNNLKKWLLYKLIYKFSVILIKMPKNIWEKFEYIPKFIWKYKWVKIAGIFLRKRNNGIDLSN